MCKESSFAADYHQGADNDLLTRMTHKTRALVLRSIKYGDSSLVVTMFTERFGLQTYMVNGVRTEKKSAQKAMQFQPGALLQLEAYHYPQKEMQRIKESNWAVLYQHLYSDVVKHSIALFLIELLHKCLKHPEENSDLFYFCEDALQQLDRADATVTANFALYFCLQLSHFFGFRLHDTSNETTNWVGLDLVDGVLTDQLPAHAHLMQGELVNHTMELLKVMHPEELRQFAFHHFTRRALLEQYIQFYALHIPDFGTLKTWKIIQEIFA